QEGQDDARHGRVVQKPGLLLLAHDMVRVTVPDLVTEHSRELRLVADAEQEPRVQVDETAGYGERVDRAVVDDAEAIFERLRGIEPRDNPLPDAVHVGDDGGIAHDRQRPGRLDRETLAELSLLGDRVTHGLADERHERYGDTRDRSFQ